MTLVGMDPVDQWCRPNVVLRVEDLAERWGCTYMEAKRIAVEAGETEFVLPNGAYLYPEYDLHAYFGQFIAKELAEKRFEDARKVLMQNHIDFMAEQLAVLA